MLASIDLVSECSLEGLTAGLVFRGHTPERIAELYQESLDGADDLTRMIDFAASLYTEESMEKIENHQTFFEKIVAIFSRKM